MSANKIASGTLDIDRIPDLNASKINDGIIDANRIPDLNASKINDGIIDANRIPDLSANKIASGTLDIDRIPDLNASKINDGIIDANRIPDLNANKIASGTLDIDRISDGSITASKLASLTSIVLDPQASIPNVSGLSVGTILFDQANNTFKGVTLEDPQSSAGTKILSEIAGGGGKTSVKIASSGNNEKGMFIQENDNSSIKFYTSVNPDDAHDVGSTPDMEIQFNKIKIKNTLSVKDLVIQNPVSIAGTINLKNDQNTFANFVDSFVNVKYEENTSENTKNLIFDFDENTSRTNFMNIKDAYVKTRGINLINSNVASISSGTIDPSLEGTLMYDTVDGVFKGITKVDGNLTVGQIAGSGGGGSSGTTETVTFPKKWDFDSIDKMHTSNVYIYEEVYLHTSNCYKDADAPSAYGLVKLLNDSVFPSGSSPMESYFCTNQSTSPDYRLSSVDNNPLQITLRFPYFIRRLNSIQFQQVQWNNDSLHIGTLGIILKEADGQQSKTITKTINTPRVPSEPGRAVLFDVSYVDFDDNDNNFTYNCNEIVLQITKHSTSDGHYMRIMNFKLNYDRDIQKPLLRYPPAAWTSPATNSGKESSQIFDVNAYGNGLYKIYVNSVHYNSSWENPTGYAVTNLFDRSYPVGYDYHSAANDSADNKWFTMDFPKHVCIQKIVLTYRLVDGEETNFSQRVLQPKNLTMWGVPDKSSDLHLIKPIFGDTADFDFTTYNNTKIFYRTIVYNNTVAYKKYKWLFNQAGDYTITGDFGIYGYEDTDISTGSITTNNITATNMIATNMIATNMAATNIQRYWSLNAVTSGGGTISVSSDGYIKWSARIIALPLNVGMFPNGHINIYMPTTDTKISHYHESNVITTRSVATEGIELKNWEALWYRVPSGHGHATTNSNYVITHYVNKIWVPDETWILIALKNGDSTGCIKYLPGQVNIALGSSFNSTQGLHWDNVQSKPTVVTSNYNGSITVTGHVYADHLNMSHSASNRNTDDVFYSSRDKYIRKNTKSGMRTSLDVPTRAGGDASGTWNININGSSEHTYSVRMYARIRNGSYFDGGGGRMYYSGHDKNTSSTIYTYFGTNHKEPGLFTTRNNYGYIGRIGYQFFRMYAGAFSTFTGSHLNKIKPNKMNDEGMIVVIDPEGEHYSSDYSNIGIDAIKINEALPSLKISNKAYDKSVFGVISKQEINSTLYNVNGVGEGAIWVSDMNGPIESGDYITSSDLCGYGMKQDEEQMMNYTVAKITMDCDFEAELEPKLKIKKHAIMSNVEAFEELEKVETTTIVEFDEILGLYLNKTSNYTVKEKVELFDEFPIYEYHDVPLYSNQIVGTSNIYDNSNVVVGTSNVYSNVVIGTSNMLVNTSNVHKVRRYSNVEIEENVLDSNGELIWEPELDSNGDMIMQPAYKMRYLNSNSDIITLDDYLEAKSNNVPVYRAAFVGCTYHCS